MEAVANCPIVAIPGLPIWATPVICVGYALLEYWLGKTDKTSSGSVPELLLNVAKGLVKPGAPKP